MYEPVVDIPMQFKLPFEVPSMVTNPFDQIRETQTVRQIPKYDFSLEVKVINEAKRQQEEDALQEAQKISEQLAMMEHQYNKKASGKGKEPEKLYQSPASIASAATGSASAQFSPQSSYQVKVQSPGSFSQISKTEASGSQKMSSPTLVPPPKLPLNSNPIANAGSNPSSGLSITSTGGLGHQPVNVPKKQGLNSSLFNDMHSKLNMSMPHIAVNQPPSPEPQKRPNRLPYTSLGSGSVSYTHLPQVSEDGSNNQSEAAPQSPPKAMSSSAHTSPIINQVSYSTQHLSPALAAGTDFAGRLRANSNPSVTQGGGSTSMYNIPVPEVTYNQALPHNEQQQYPHSPMIGSSNDNRKKSKPPLPPRVNMPPQPQQPQLQQHYQGVHSNSASMSSLVQNSSQPSTITYSQASVATAGSNSYPVQPQQQQYYGHTQHQSIGYPTVSMGSPHMNHASSHSWHTSTSQQQQPHSLSQPQPHTSLSSGVTNQATPVYQGYPHIHHQPNSSGGSAAPTLPPKPAELQNSPIPNVSTPTATTTSAFRPTYSMPSYSASVQYMMPTASTVAAPQPAVAQPPAPSSSSTVATAPPIPPKPFEISQYDYVPDSSFIGGLNTNNTHGSTSAGGHHHGGSPNAHISSPHMHQGGAGTSSSSGMINNSGYNAVASTSNVAGGGMVSQSAEQVDSLTQMGFKRPQAIQALEMFDYDLERATNYLLDHES
ncbi:hypothetical protein H4219_002059 [Mycoemilia scoparia]|uniref:UBA domain-containing protein n=1 Tax=Mycoemilia scoparia TaxID=417184 RepID=A0A9W8DUJ6_9FUNG|nr:hypothetical protein H4219_002059 [Mycoemilia scoparia]